MQNDVADRKLGLGGKITVPAAVSELGDYYVLDFFPCLPSPVLQVPKDSVEIGPEISETTCPDGVRFKLSLVSIKNDSGVLVVYPARADSGQVRAIIGGVGGVPQPPGAAPGGLEAALGAAFSSAPLPATLPTTGELEATTAFDPYAGLLPPTGQPGAAFAPGQEAAGLFGVDWACLPCKPNPMYWQAVGLLKLARSAGLIRNQAQCEAVVGNAAALTPILATVFGGGLPAWAGPVIAFITKFCGKCACKTAF